MPKHLNAFKRQYNYLPGNKIRIEHSIRFAVIRIHGRVHAVLSMVDGT